MQTRTDNVTYLASHQLAVSPELVEGIVRYAALLDGRRCGWAPTREAAIQSLLRRVIAHTMH